MKELTLLFGREDENQEHSAFSQMVSQSVSGILSASNLNDVNHILEDLRSKTKKFNLTAEQKYELKRVRQKAYDKKKSLKVQIQDDKTKNEKETIMPTTIIESTPPDPKKILKKQNYYLILSLLFIAFIGISWLLIEQTVPLYKSVNFPNPILTAFGALITMTGFAIYHALSKSILSIVLCAFSGIYEVGFIIAASQSNEVQISEIKLSKSPEIEWQKEKIAEINAKHQTFKARFENPDSKVYQNAWFKSQYLDPSWKKYSAAQEKLKELRTEKRDSGASSSTYILILKILYRLGFILLVVIITHEITRLSFINR